MFPYSARSVQGQNSKFVHRIHRDAQRVTAVDAIDIGSAVQQVVVRFRPLSVDRERLPGARNAACANQPVRHRRHTWLKKTELRNVTAIQRKIRRLCAGDNRTDRLTRIDHRRLRGDIHTGVAARNFEDHRISDRLTDIDTEPGHRERRETLRVDRQRVFAYREIGETERSIVGGLSRTGQTGLRIFCADRGIGDDRLGRIGNLTLRGCR